MLNQEPFGKTDPVFHKDIAFYVFTLPVIETALGLVNFVILASAFAAVLGHFIYGGIEWDQKKGLKLTRAARTHVGIIAMAYMLVLAAQH